MTIMPEKTKRDALAATGKRPRHGIYSWVDSKRLPRGRAFQKVRRELGVLREELVQAHGGQDIGPDAMILVDSIVEGLGVQKILGLYIREHGVIDGQAAKQKRLELSPILGKNWVSYANVVRQGVLALKEIDKGRQPTEPNIMTVIAEFDKEQAAQAALAAEKRPVVPQDGRSPEDSRKGTGDSDDTPGGENDDKGGEDNG
jgi:hypothetical protein